MSDPTGHKQLKLWRSRFSLAKVKCGTVDGRYVHHLGGINHENNVFTISTGAGFLPSTVVVPLKSCSLTGGETIAGFYTWLTNLDLNISGQFTIFPKPELLPGKLTWNLKIIQLKRKSNHLPEVVFHVNFPAGFSSAFLWGIPLLFTTFFVGVTSYEAAVKFAQMFGTWKRNNSVNA